LEKQAMPEEPRQLGRYELIKRIAVGGMGEIYLAKSRGTAGFEKTVIIKKILDHLAEEEEFVTKFLDEGRIVVNLTHGNIVPVFDMGEEDGEYFIAMEYLPARDLRDVLTRLRKGDPTSSDQSSSDQSSSDQTSPDRLIPAHLAVHICIEVCKGLDYAHRRTDDAGNPLDIVHRDVSPSNILISKDGEVKIIDFGIARAASRAAKTVSGRIQGKICYMSPEQAGGKSVDARSDVFSTGVVLYEMLTGRRPFQGDSDLQSLDLVRQCQFDTPSDVNPDIPPELDAIVNKALSRDRQTRYQSSDELHVELLEWLYSGGRAVTSQQLSEFVRDLFPGGVERDDLRRARDASSASADGPMNLEDALNAELERMDNELDTPRIDPLRTTATELADGPADLGRVNSGRVTSTLDDGVPGAPEAGSPAAGSPKTGSSPDLADGDDAEDRTKPDRAGSDSRQLTDKEQPGATTTAEAAREDERPDGFKRWLAIALAVGVIAGAAVLYAYAATEYGKVEVRTEPAGAAIEVDGVKVSGAKTPYTVEVESGKRAVTVSKEGFSPQTFELEVKRTKTQLLDDGTIELQPVTSDDELRQAWVTVVPHDALIKIDNAQETTTGKARITVSPDKQVLVEASHPDCKTATKVVNYVSAAQPIGLTLECEDPALEIAKKSADVGAEADAASDEKPAKAAARPRYKIVRFTTDPPGGDIQVDGEDADGPRRLRIGQRVALNATLPGYAPVDKSLRVSHTLGSRYTIELEKLPTGCLKFVAINPAVARVEIDGEFKEETGMGRWTLSAGSHRITVSNKVANKAAETHTVDIEPGKCTNLVVWEKPTDEDETGTN
jgi:serine/threonine protein kinase